MPLAITSPYMSNATPTHLPWATLCQSRLYPPVRDLGFGLCLVYVRRFIENKGEYEILLFL